MVFSRSLRILFVSHLTLTMFALAQQQAPPVQPSAAPPPTQGVRLDVVVDAKAGQPFTGLQQQDFTILDNKSTRPITSFKVLTPDEKPVEVFLIIDAVNVSYQAVTNIRLNAEAFLKENGGKLAHPTTLSVLTATGLQTMNPFTTNGIALSDDLEHRQTGGVNLHEIANSSQGGEFDRLNICMTALQQLIASASALPGRKIILWISPGWPLIDHLAVELPSKKMEQIFGEVVDLSTKLRESETALYAINPAGVSESLGQDGYYKAFLKGPAKPGDANFAYLGLQVFSVHSGGLTFVGNSDVAGMLRQSLLDADSWYEITFDPLPADKPNEYHHIEVRVDRPGLTARGPDSYYSNIKSGTPAN